MMTKFKLLGSILLVSFFASQSFAIDNNSPPYAMPLYSDKQCLQFKKGLQFCMHESMCKHDHSADDAFYKCGYGLEWSIAYCNCTLQDPSDSLDCIKEANKLTADFITG